MYEADGPDLRVRLWAGLYLYTYGQEAGTL